MPERGCTGWSDDRLPVQPPDRGLYGEAHPRLVSVLSHNWLWENPQKCGLPWVRTEVAPSVGTDESELESGLVDLTGISLERIALLPDSALAASLRRILTDDSDATERYAGFQNRI